MIRIKDMVPDKKSYAFNSVVTVSCFGTYFKTSPPQAQKMLTSFFFEVTCFSEEKRYILP